MKRSKKTESAANPSRHLDHENERNMEEFADLYIESMKEQFQANQEPFEAYAQKLQAHLRSDEFAYKKRIINGYNALLAEISSKNENN